MTSPHQLAEIIETGRHTFTTEDELQASIHDQLTALGGDTIREVRLTGGLGRIDLQIGAVGIEVKTKGPASTVVRQLLRYTHAEELEHLLLVTTRAKHVQAVNALEPTRIPITAVYLGEAGL